jgi:hypothetical protein
MERNACLWNDDGVNIWPQLLVTAALSTGLIRDQLPIMSFPAFSMKSSFNPPSVSSFSRSACLWGAMYSVVITNGWRSASSAVIRVIKSFIGIDFKIRSSTPVAIFF